MSQSENPCVAYLNSMRQVEDALQPEWARAEKVVFDDGNQGWSMIATLAIQYLRDEIESLREEINEGSSGTDYGTGRKPKMPIMTAVLWPLAWGYALWYGKHVAPLAEPSVYAVGHFVALGLLTLAAICCNWASARS